MENFIYILKNLKYYIWWLKRHTDSIDYDRGIGCCFHIHTTGDFNDLYAAHPIKDKMGWYKVLENGFCKFLGFEGEKFISECSFKEFMDIYIIPIIFNEKIHLT